MLSWLVLTVFMIWALVPNHVLEHCGVHYYPSKYWAQALPAYFLMSMLYSYIFIACYNTEVKTLRLDDVRLITDEHAVYPEKPEEYIWRAPSGVWDLPIGLVNEVLYGESEGE